MDAYKPPNASLTDPLQGISSSPCKPFKAVALGLGCAVVLTMIASSILSLIFAFELEPRDTYDLHQKLANQYSFLVLDSIITIAILYLSGRTIKRWAPGKEKKCSLVVTTLTLLLFLCTFLFHVDTYLIYPLWYHATLVSAIFWAVFLGAWPSTKQGSI